MGMKKGAAALLWNKERDNAPRLIASGRGYLAEKILALANEADIPIVEEGTMAELLFSMEPGQEIPEELFQLAAEVYAFILDIEDIMN